MPGFDSTARQITQCFPMATTTTTCVSICSIGFVDFDGDNDVQQWCRLSWWQRRQRRLFQFTWHNNADTVVPSQRTRDCFDGNNDNVYCFDLLRWRLEDDNVPSRQPRALGTYCQVAVANNLRSTLVPTYCFLPHKILVGSSLFSWMSCSVTESSHFCIH